jgi:hypothetical protein
VVICATAALVYGSFDFLKEADDPAISCGLLQLGFSQLSTESVQENDGFTQTSKLLDCRLHLSVQESSLSSLL